MMTQEQIDKFTTDMIADGYILGETFGLIYGIDAPGGHISNSSTLTKFWYKSACPVTGEIET